MKKLDTSAMDRVLNKWLEDNGIECVASADTDFAYYYADSLITYSLVVSERADRLFLNFAKSIGLEVDCGIFVLSFLHEVGHNETIEDIDEMDYAFSQDVKTTLGNTDKDFEIYFNLPDELMATEWAIDFINNNVENVRQLAQDFQKEFEIFCKKYRIKG